MTREFKATLDERDSGNERDSGERKNVARFAEI
jgi:hypothetical protein